MLSLLQGLHFKITLKRIEVATKGGCNACNSDLKVGESEDIVVSAAVSGVGEERVSCNGVTIAVASGSCGAYQR